MTRLALPSILSAALLAAGPGPGAAEPAALSFLAMSCGPYRKVDRQALPRQLRDLESETSSAFLAHLGDVGGWKAFTDEDAIDDIAGLMRRNLPARLDLVVVPGDNELDDQARFGLPAYRAARERWRRGFRAAPSTTGEVRQEGYPEHVRFLRGGVLVIGLDRQQLKEEVLAPEWALRARHIAAWLRGSFAAHPEARAGVILAQSDPAQLHDVLPGREALWDGAIQPVIEALREVAADFAPRPILWLQGDHHVWSCRQSWGERPPDRSWVPRWPANMLRVVTDVQRPALAPIRVEVRPEAPLPFLLDRRLDAGLEPLRPEELDRPEKTRQRKATHASQLILLRRVLAGERSLLDCCLVPWFQELARVEWTRSYPPRWVLRELARRWSAVAGLEEVWAQAPGLRETLGRRLTREPVP